MGTRHKSNPELTEQPSQLMSLASPIAAFITPHHLLAEAEMHTIFQIARERTRNNKIQRIILLSPNHFHIGNSWIVSSKRDWETPFGRLETDKTALEQLDGVLVGRNILEREHGVRNILPFIREYFPEALVIPLALEDGFPDRNADTLAQELSRLSDDHTLLIVSADFSHYLDTNFSRLHDEATLQVLHNMDVSHVNALDVDCVACLRVAMRYAALRQAPSFSLVSRSSSLEMTGSKRVGEETSHITGYFSSPNETKEDRERLGDGEATKSTSLLFAGSLQPVQMTEQARRVFMGQEQNIFEENAVVKTGFFSLSALNKMTAVTKLFEQDSHFILKEIGGENIGFVDANMERWSLQDILSTITSARQVTEWVVVLWKEGSRMDQSIEREMRHHFVDAGATLVIGHGASDIRPLESYRGKIILPALGNIDQGCRTKDRNCARILVAVTFAGDKIEYAFMPVVMGNDGLVVLATGQEREVLLGNIFPSSVSRNPNASLQDIREGFFTMFNE